MARELETGQSWQARIRHETNIQQDMVHFENING
jgi:hypothetical protein